jgi:hypothetical protein
MMIFLLSVSIIGLLAFVWAKNLNRSEKPVFWAALFMKLLAGCLLGILYHYHYQSGDTLKYFRVAVQLSEFAHQQPFKYLEYLWTSNEAMGMSVGMENLEPRSVFFIKLVSLVSLMTFSNYWATSLWFSFVGFIGAWLLAREISRKFPNAAAASFFSFLFFPSLVFWSSGIIKETIALAALFFLSYLLLVGWNAGRLRWFEWLLACLAIWLAWSLKYYWCAVFLAISASSVIVKFVSNRFFWKKGAFVLLWFLIVLLMGLVVSLVHPNFYTDRFVQVVVENYQAYRIIGGESLIDYGELNPTFWSLATHAPWGLITGLFRPFIWETHNALSLIYSLENAGILLLSIFSLTRLKNIWSSPDWILIVSILVYTIVLGVFLSLSTPNFGTLARYRVGFLPFFVFLVSYTNPVFDHSFRYLQQRIAKQYGRD